MLGNAGHRQDQQVDPQDEIAPGDARGIDRDDAKEEGSLMHKKREWKLPLSRRESHARIPTVRDKAWQTKEIKRDRNEWDANGETEGRRKKKEGKGRREEKGLGEGRMMTGGGRDGRKGAGARSRTMWEKRKLIRSGSTLRRGSRPWEAIAGPVQLLALLIATSFNAPFDQSRLYTPERVLISILSRVREEKKRGSLRRERANRGK